MYTPVPPKKPLYIARENQMNQSPFKSDIEPIAFNTCEKTYFYIEGMVEDHIKPVLVEKEIKEYKIEKVPQKKAIVIFINSSSSIARMRSIIKRINAKYNSRGVYCYELTLKIKYSDFNKVVEIIRRNKEIQEVAVINHKDKIIETASPQASLKIFVSLKE